MQQSRMRGVEWASSKFEYYIRKIYMNSRVKGRFLYLEYCVNVEDLNLWR